MVVFVYVHREFPHESCDERILKIGPHLLKLLSNIKGYTFLGHSVYIYRKVPAIVKILVYSLTVFL